MNFLNNLFTTKKNDSKKRKLEDVKVDEVPQFVGDIPASIMIKESHAVKLFRQLLYALDFLFVKEKKNCFSIEVEKSHIVFGEDRQNYHFYIEASKVNFIDLEELVEVVKRVDENLELRIITGESLSPNIQHYMVSKIISE